MTPKPPAKQPIPILPLLRFLVVGELIVAVVVGAAGYLIFKWPTLWHYGIGMVVGGIFVCGIGAYSSMGTETALRRQQIGQGRGIGPTDLRALGGVSREKRDEQDRKDVRSAVSFFWLALMLGCLTMSVGVALMMIFVPGG